MIKTAVYFLVASSIIWCVTSVDVKEIDRYESRCPELSKEARIAHLKLPYFRPIPRYPADAARKRIEGYVIFEFDISIGGQPMNINVLESYPSKTFVKIAERNFRGYKFRPTLSNGEAVVSQCHEMKLNFKLE